jgi:tRNA threonylcarbamoyladenosine biosynthesis protein TsaB
MLLAIDTCGEVGTVALGRMNGGAAHLLTEVDLAGKTYAAVLIPRIGDLLAAAGARLADLDAIIIVHGPGSFTGVRVGVSAAKGLAEVSGRPLIAISRLALLSRGSGGSSAFAVLDAGRREYYLGEYRRGVIKRETLVTAGGLPAALAGVAAPLIVCEEQVEQALEAFSPVRVRLPRAADALELGAGRLAAGIFDDVSSLDGNYLRRSDAELFGHKAE